MNFIDVKGINSWSSAVQTSCPWHIVQMFLIVTELYFYGSWNNSHCAVITISVMSGALKWIHSGLETGEEQPTLWWKVGNNVQHTYCIRSDAVRVEWSKEWCSEGVRVWWSEERYRRVMQWGSDAVRKWCSEEVMQCGCWCSEDVMQYVMQWRSDAVSITFYLWRKHTDR